ncbi:YheC/YheD family protein [Cytobacillus sp. FJAT-54145]|uniref:YheC/YheD family protein n=1 Tax=Cytobacillus spartinae TaxID=3299023 RepID=A0ABW6K6R6_9BACI
MVYKVGKLEQSLLLQSDSLTKKHFPETIEYRKENIGAFLEKYNTIYVKHDTSGQGRGVFRVTQSKNNQVLVDGYTLFSKAVSGEKSLEEFHKILNPFERLGRIDPYIIQEGISSVTPDGNPFAIRVHVQRVKGQWVVGGMYGNIGTANHQKNGVINRYRGTKPIPVDELFVKWLGMNSGRIENVRQKIQEVSLATAEVIYAKYPCREYGIDMGVDASDKPVVFEVNTTPGIGSFHGVDINLWKNIVNNRKLS